MSEVDHAAWNAWVVAQFRELDGQVPGYESMPVLLLTTIGASSGEPRVVPLCYVPDGSRYLVTPVNGGRARTPAWFSNLLAHDVARIDVGTQSVDVRASMPTGEERTDLWDRFVAAQPTYVEHAAGRDLPVVVLEPVDPMR